MKFAYSEMMTAMKTIDKEIEKFATPPSSFPKLMKQESKLVYFTLKYFFKYYMPSYVPASAGPRCMRMARRTAWIKTDSNAYLKYFIADILFAIPTDPQND